MKPISFKRHRFPADVIRHAVWLYLRFNLCVRDVEELLAQRRIDVSHETIRCWAIKFGPLIARRLKKRRCAPPPRWHLDKMVCWIGGKRMCLWRAVDDQGEVLDFVVQRRRDTEAAMKLLKRLLHNQPVERRRRSRPTAWRRTEWLWINWIRGICVGRVGFGRTTGLRTTPADSTTRTPAAEVQIPSLRPEVPHHPNADLQYVQPPAPFHQQTDTSAISRRGGVRVGG